MYKKHITKTLGVDQTTLNKTPINTHNLNKMIQIALIILVLIQIRYTFKSIFACAQAEAVKATWQQIIVLGIELIMIAYLYITRDVQIFIQ